MEAVVRKTKIIQDLKDVILIQQNDNTVRVGYR